MKRNPLFAGLSEKYLFHEVKTRVEAFKKSHPNAHVISLGIGDTTEPLVETIAREIKNTGHELETVQGYRGYGPEQGILELRKAIQETLYTKTPSVSEQDIFISDGAKCDISRLHLLFGEDTNVAVQEPSYPAYKDSSLLLRKKNPIPLPCLTRNQGIISLDLEALPDETLVFLCSPNNPTGTLFTRSEIEKLIQAAKKKKHILIFDVAYRDYAEDGAITSIYEIPGADEVAIEIGSFSKSAGFSGIRLGWTVIPEKIQYSDGKSVRNDFMRLITTTFNGASYITQKAGLTALGHEGRLKTLEQVHFYKENTRILRDALVQKGANVFGGKEAPYLWITTRFEKSWDAFEYFLHTGQLVTTPGIGFGASGEGFVRISGFGRREVILEASQRILQLDL